MAIVATAAWRRRMLASFSRWNASSFCSQTNMSLHSVPPTYRLHAGSNLFKVRGHKLTVNCARTLWSWGSADHGRGGSGGHTDAPIFEIVQHEPEKIEKPVLPAKLIKKVACGGAHSLLVTESGRLLTCGLNDSGQLGRGNLDNASEFDDVKGMESISDVAAGFWHTVAATKKGKLYTWGSNKHGQLGHHDTSIKMALEPQEVQLLRNAFIKQVACGSYHTMALTSDGEVYSWGFGAHGRLGHGSTEDEFMPKRVEALVGENISSIHAGYEYSSAVSTSGKVFIWGYGHFYVMGQRDKKDQLVPLVLDFPGSIKQLAFGSFHGAAISHSGTLFTWGHAMHGPLGLGSDAPNIVVEPTVVSTPAQLQNSKQVACGSKHTLVVTGTGDVFSFGSGEHGQLGLGMDLDQYEPRQIPRFLGKSLRQVACGLFHCIGF